MTSLIPQRESLTVEFKSDRDRLPDRDLVAAVVCLANTEGAKSLSASKTTAASRACTQHIKTSRGLAP